MYSILDSVYISLLVLIVNFLGDRAVSDLGIVKKPARYGVVKLMEEGDNFIANITKLDPLSVTVPTDSTVGICGLNGTLLKEYVRYGRRIQTYIQGGPSGHRLSNVDSTFRGCASCSYSARRSIEDSRPEEFVLRVAPDRRRQRLPGAGRGRAHPPK